MNDALPGRPRPPLTELLRHAGPMFLLERIVYWDRRTIRCSASIEPGGLFVRDGQVRGAVLIEYMGQAVAACAGLIAFERGELPRPGYIIGINKFSLDVDAVQPGDALLIEAERIFGDGELGSFTASATRDSKVLCTASMTVLLVDEER